MSESEPSYDDIADWFEDDMGVGHFRLNEKGVRLEGEQNAKMISHFVCSMDDNIKMMEKMVRWEPDYGYHYRWNKKKIEKYGNGN